MEKLAGKLADHFYDKENFPDISYESFKYVMEFALEMAAGIFASAVIAAAYEMEWETALFLVIFWVLRSYAGGIHLDKFSHCFVFSFCVIAVTMAVVKYAQAPFWLSHILFMLGAAGFVLTAPESDKNRKVDGEEDAYFRVKLRNSLVLIAGLYLLFSFLRNSRYTFLIAVSVDVVYLLMILGKIKNGKYRKITAV